MYAQKNVHDVKHMNTGTVNEPPINKANAVYSAYGPQLELENMN